MIKVEHKGKTRRYIFLCTKLDSEKSGRQHVGGFFYLYCMICSKLFPVIKQLIMMCT